MSGPKKWVHKLGRTRSSGNDLAVQHQPQHQHQHQHGHEGAAGSGDNDNDNGNSNSNSNCNASPPRSAGHALSRCESAGLALSPAAPSDAASGHDRNGGGSGGRGRGRGRTGSGGGRSAGSSPGTPKKSWERHYKSFLSKKSKWHGGGGGGGSGSSSSHARVLDDGAADMTEGPPMPALKPSKSLPGAGAGGTDESAHGPLALPHLRWKPTTPTGAADNDGPSSSSSLPALGLAMGEPYAGESGGHALDQSHWGGGRDLLALSPGGSVSRVAPSANRWPGKAASLSLSLSLSATAAQRRATPPCFSTGLDHCVPPLPLVSATTTMTSSSSSLSSSSLPSAENSKVPQGKNIASIETIDNGTSGSSKSGRGLAMARRGAGAGDGKGDGDGDKAVRGGSLFKTVFKHERGGGGGGSSMSLSSLQTTQNRHVGHFMNSRFHENSTHKRLCPISPHQEEKSYGGGSSASFSSFRTSEKEKEEEAEMPHRSAPNALLFPNHTNQNQKQCSRPHYETNNKDEAAIEAGSKSETDRDVTDTCKTTLSAHAPRGKSYSCVDLDSSVRRGREVSYSRRRRGDGEQLRMSAPSTPSAPIAMGDGRACGGSVAEIAAAAAAAASFARPATYYSHDNAGDVTVRAAGVYVATGAGAGGSGQYRPSVYKYNPPTRWQHHHHHHHHRQSPPWVLPRHVTKSISDGTANMTAAPAMKAAAEASESPAVSKSSEPPYSHKTAAYHFVAATPGGRNVYHDVVWRDELDTSRRNREKKMAFTEFHNSDKFGTDATSPYLGDEPSVRDAHAYRPAHRSPSASASAPAVGEEGEEEDEDDLFGPSSGCVVEEGELSPKPSQYRVALEVVDENAAKKGAESTGMIVVEAEAQNGSNLPPPPRTPNLIVVETTAAESSTRPSPFFRVLDPIEESGDWSSDTQVNGRNTCNLVAPAVLALCPPRVLEMLSSAGTCTGVIALGMAVARRLSPPNASDELDGANAPWSSGRFMLHNNYLLEYSYFGGGESGHGHCNGYGNGNGNSTYLPRGYAHLQDALVQPYEGDRNDTLQLNFHSAEAGWSTAKLLIRVESREERDRWMAAITKAARLTAHDLYEYNRDGGQELGRGRYATVWPARRRERSDGISSSPVRLGGGGGGTAPSTARVETEEVDDDHLSALPQPSPSSSSSSFSSFSSERLPSTTHSSADDGRGGGQRISGASASSFDRDRYDCALKIVKKAEFLSRVRKGQERSDALMREVSVQSALVMHQWESAAPPSFLGLRGFFETRDELVLELELLEGTNLFRYITLKGEPLDEVEAARFMKDLLSCLDLMGRLGIAHRDVKPANIFMCDADNGRNPVSVKLGDFGMATFVGPDGLVKGRCGTPGYVAPEIFRTGPNTGYKNKVDVFSAGVTLHIMLCGYEPFYGESEKELVEANKRGKIAFDECDWAGVSVEGRDLVEKMLHADPEKRITAEDALRHPWIRRRAPAAVELANVASNVSTKKEEICTVS